MIFLSYNTSDWGFADRLYENLLHEGLECWFDIEKKYSDEKFSGEIYKVIAGMDCVIALFGPNGIGKSQVKEIRYAKRKGIPLVSVRIPGCSDKASYYLEYSSEPSIGITKRITPSTLRRLVSLIKPLYSQPTKESTDRHVLVFSGAPASGTGNFCRRLAKRLTDALGDESCQILPMARYYETDKIRLPKSVERFERSNFDDPGVINFRAILSDIRRLVRGFPIRLRDYDKQTHLAGHVETIHPPKRFLLLHGVYLLQNDSILKESRATFYVDVDAEVRYARRLWEEIVDYEMDCKSVLEYYWNRVRPAVETFVTPYINKAHLIVKPDAGDDGHNYHHLEVDPQVELVMDFLKSNGLI